MLSWLDFGDVEIANVKSEMAKEVLCFMVVPYNASWKLPVAYFFVAGLDASGKVKGRKVLKV